MAVYCVVENGIVTNAVEWDGVTPFQPYPDVTLVLAGDDGKIGATWDGSKFISEPTPIVTPATATDPAQAGPTVL